MKKTVVLSFGLVALLSWRLSSAADESETIQAAFLKEDYDTVEKLVARKTKSSFAKSRTNDELRHLRALSLMKLGRYDESRWALADLENSAVDPAMKATAAVSTADTYFVQQRYPDARHHYRRSLAEYHDFDEEAYAKERVAEIDAMSPEAKKV